MSYTSLADCVDDLEKTGRLVRITEPISPYLDIPALQRRVYRAGGPALLFTNVEGTPFPVVGNLFGTLERTHFIFRHGLEAARLLIDLKASPEDILKHPARLKHLPKALCTLLPKQVKKSAVTAHETTVSNLPGLVSWPKDGGPFITLPQVYSEDPDKPGWRFSNLGMYRVQLSGNSYKKDGEVGLHYQIHRGLGVHHTKATQKGVPLRVVVSVGGPPSLALSAVMPLPENIPELLFAGVLGGRRIRITPYEGKKGGIMMPADADFCLVGTIDPTRLLPEGPFGDHLGYYSLQHNYPVLNIEKVYHRAGAIWPFTSVGRPPQEDSTFGQFIHELTGSIIPTVLPGVKEVHAVDAAGVHPLLLAIGSERYTPYLKEATEPQEILTQANAILGQGQLSLAKYLIIVSKNDNPPDAHDIPAFFAHWLSRVDLKRDLHFQTCTTIDTLDYSGVSLNKGSKLVIAAAGPIIRKLATEIPADLNLPDGFKNPRVVMPGILAITGPAWTENNWDEQIWNGPRSNIEKNIQKFPLIVVVDDSDFVVENINNFLWTTFTRSDPARDVHGLNANYADKHWGCTSMIIDARTKTHHAPALEEDPTLLKKLDHFFVKGAPLEKWSK